MIALSIVIPLYNEEETLPILYQRINKLLPELKKLLSPGPDRETAEVEVLFVNDGSNDNSLSILELIVADNGNYRYISLSRNFGHQPAISAGLRCAKGDLVVIMDGDLQDPPELIIDMIKKHKDGFDVVYAVRQKREAKIFKKIAYRLYYIFNSLISDQPVQKDSGDFCLLSQKVVGIINKLPEKEIYIRGLRAWAGFKQFALSYDRIDRKTGKSKYSFRSLAKLAFRGILSTSTKPLFISGLFSIISILIIFSIIVYVLLSKIFVQPESLPKGWISLMITISVLNGFQLLSLWMLSLYIAKIYSEILARPPYLIEKDSLT